MYTGHAQQVQRERVTLPRQRRRPLVLAGLPRAARWVFPASVLAVSAALYLVSRANYLLFHSLVELAAIITSALFFTVAVIMFRRAGHDLLFLLATGFFWSAVIDLVHTLAYKGMGVFPGYTANLPTQLWVLARYLESLVILGSAVLLGHQVRRWWVPPTIVGAAAAIGLAVVFLGAFPTAYVEGSGLTPFKVMSEYVIIALLVAALVIMWKRRNLVTPWTLRWLVTAMVLTILAELSFTRYIGVYGTANALGHIFKFMAYAAMFRLVVRNMLERPLQAFGAVVPICASCKAVRVDEDTWTTVEEFLEGQSGRMISHGLCPKCYEKWSKSAVRESLEGGPGNSPQPA